MKNIINYYYNLFPEEIEEEKGSYYFFINEIKYYLVVILRPTKDLSIINEINNELQKIKISSHSIIPNKDKNLFTKFNEKNYVLMMLNANPNNLITITDFIINQEKTKIINFKNDLIRGNWEKLWSEKVDYFEYQIRELGKDKKIILNSFSYYVGLAENAISYANAARNNSKEASFYLCHKKIYFPYTNLNYLNPLSFIFDLKVRDIAEYFKSLFFNGLNPWNEIFLYFEKVKLTTYELEMFYARLLYPSYYFDMYEKIMNNICDEQELINIIEKVSDYEDFLREIFLYLNKNDKLSKIEWLIKKGS